MLDALRRPESLGKTAIGLLLLAAFAYTVLLGGTILSELLPPVRIVTACVGGVLVLFYLNQAPRYLDRVDALILGGLLLYFAAGVLSLHPRQSFDAMLAGLAWVAATFLARRQMAHERSRTAFIAVCMALSGVLTIVVAARWLPVLETWWSSTGFAIPALDLDYSAVPWGHWHDLALLLALLYPAWWVGRLTPLRVALALVVGSLVLGIVFVDGARDNWIALTVATAYVGLPRLLSRVGSVRRLAAAVLGVIVVILALVVMSGAWEALAERFGNLANLGYRGAMWGPLTGAWISRPISGYGPGSFPWILQTTDYFTTNSYAPRHPDSAVFQLLAEAGLLGVAALACLLLAAVPSAMRSRSIAATWSLIAFAVASLAANPTDFAFLIAVAIAWFGFAAPNDRTSSNSSPNGWHRLPRVVNRLSAAVIGVAYLATLLAAFSYQRLGDAIAAGMPADAIAPLEVAVSLDPGLALYQRERGELRLELGDIRAAVVDLTAATSINPSDELAWRVLAIALRADGRKQDAYAALTNALKAQRSNSTNLLLLAQWQREDGDASGGLRTLGEIVEAWPAIVAAPGWEGLLPAGVTTEGVVDQALKRWQDGLKPPEPFVDQPIWLAVMGNRPDLFGQAGSETGFTTSLAQATINVMRCDRPSESLASLPTNDRRGYQYWLLRLRASALGGSPDPLARDLVLDWGGGPLLPQTATETLNPLNENGTFGFSTDVWGYRRPSTYWPPATSALPSVQAATAAWLLDPNRAIRDADLRERFPECR